MLDVFGSTDCERCQSTSATKIIIPHTCSTEDLLAQVKKLFRQLALRFHPDKAVNNCRFAMRFGGQAGAMLVGTSELQARIRAEADWLFKAISEAQTVLTDPEARFQVRCAAWTGWAVQGFV